MEIITTLLGMIGLGILTALALMVVLCLIVFLYIGVLSKLKRMGRINYESRQKATAFLVWLVIILSVTGSVFTDISFLSPELDGLYHLLFHIIAVIVSLIPTAIIGTIVYDLNFRDM